MRHGTSQRRQRNRGNGGRRAGQPRMQVYDSNGPDVRIRGTAHQVAEKYLALAHDASSSDDPVMAQNYLQHAEHYQRIINSWENNSQGGHAQGQGERKSSRSGNRSAQPKAQAQGNAEDDLSLPSSILGDVPQASKADVSEQAESRTSELSSSE